MRVVGAAGAANELRIANTQPQQHASAAIVSQGHAANLNIVVQLAHNVCVVRCLLLQVQDLWFAHGLA
jgi:hypothetical protein